MLAFASHSALRRAGVVEEISLASSVLSPVVIFQLQRGSQTKMELVFYALWGTKPEQRQTVDTSASLRKMEDSTLSVQLLINIIFPDLFVDTT